MTVTLTQEEWEDYQLAKSRFVKFVNNRVLAVLNDAEDVIRKKQFCETVQTGRVIPKRTVTAILVEFEKLKGKHQEEE